jgi:pimeloyl-ACP methyl ester carboxylesterase
MKYTLLTITVALLCAALPSPLHADFKPEVKYAQVGDVKLAYYIRGTGEPLLMINGFMSSMSLWDPLMIEELAKQHQLILFDNRGVGLSTDTEENKTTIPQMADDAAGLLRAIGIKKANILAYSMGARIGQQFLIRHPDLVNKAVLCAADPGGEYQDMAAPDVEAKLNNPDTPKMERLALTAPDDAAGKAALQAAIERLKAAVAAGTTPDDFEVSPQTTERQDRARTTLWNEDNSNFEDLKNVKVPVLIADGRSDEIDPPKNSLIIANQIPFAWLAYFWGGHSFLYTSPKHFADTVNVFLQPGGPVTTVKQTAD